MKLLFQIRKIDVIVMINISDLKFFFKFNEIFRRFAGKRVFYFDNFSVITLSCKKQSCIVKYKNKICFILKINE